MDGALPVRNRDGNLVPVDEFKKVFLEYVEVISFLYDLENKIMTMAISEYWNQPATLIDALRIYARVRREDEKR